MKKNLVKIDFTEVNQLEDEGLQVLIGGSSDAGIGDFFKKALETIGINVNGNCGCSTNNGCHIRN